MREIALHILDIAENSIKAGAACIYILIDEDRLNNLLRIVIQDNGKGVSREKIAELTDPFVTSSTARKIGLGLSLFEAAAQRCGGRLTVTSEPRKGTTVTTTFQYDHIDRAPLGDTAATIGAMIAGYPGIDLVYTHAIDGKTFTLDTKSIKKELSAPSEAASKLALLVTRAIHQSLQSISNDNAVS